MSVSQLLFFCLDRAFNWLTVALIFGICLAFAFAGRLALSEVALILVLCLGFLLTCLLRRITLVTFIAIGLSTVVFGLLVGQFHMQMNETPVLLKETRVKNIQASVMSVEDRRGGFRLTLTLHDAILDRNQDILLPKGAKVRVHRRNLSGYSIQVLIGATVRFSASLKPLSGPSWPGGYDFARQAWFQGVSANGFATGRLKIVTQADVSGFDWQRIVENIRSRIRDWVQSVNLPHQALVKAMLVGERSGIAKVDYEAMRDSGLAHLLAISGLHMGMVAATVYGGIRLGFSLIPALAIRYPTHKIAAILTLIFCFLFLSLTGQTVSTQRAFIMTGMVMIAILLDRQALSLRMASIAALLILVTAPFQVFSIGFQLSFTAVFGLIAFYEWWNHERSKANRLLPADRLGRFIRYFLLICLTTVIASVVTTYPAAYHFGSFPVYGVISNLLAVPFMSVVAMPIVVLTLLLFLIGIPVDPLLWFLDWAMGAILDVAHWIAAWDGSVILVPALPIEGLAFFFLGLAMLCFLNGAWRLLGLIPWLLACLVGFIEERPVLMVSEDGRMVLFSDENRPFIFTADQRRGFQLDQWKRYWAMNSRPPTVKGWSAKGSWQCDPAGCRSTGPGEGIDVVVVWDFSRLDQLCNDRAIGVLIAPVFPVSERFCKTPPIIMDLFDLKKEKALALFREGPGFRIESTEQTRKNMPWVSRSSIEN